MNEILPRLNGTAVAALIDVMPSLNSIPVIIYDDSGALQESSPRLTKTRCIRKFVPTSDAARIVQAINEVLS